MQVISGNSSYTLLLEKKLPSHFLSPFFSKSMMLWFSVITRCLFNTTQQQDMGDGHEKRLNMHLAHKFTCQSHSCMCFVCMFLASPASIVILHRHPPPLVSIQLTTSLLDSHLISCQMRLQEQTSSLGVTLMSLCQLLFCTTDTDSRRERMNDEI